MDGLGVAPLERSSDLRGFPSPTIYWKQIDAPAVA
jgi:hypothetical protein